MSNNNLAYDLTKYEDVAPDKTPKIRIHRRRAENTGSVPVMFVLAAAIGILLGAVIYGKVEEASIHAEIREQTQYVEMLNSENARMRSELEEKTALKSVETYVEDVLGMQKLDKSQIEYVSISNGSVVDIPETEDNIFVRIKHAFTDFLEYIRG
ncbi:MAG: hypothetical protein NC253_03505 [Ruminococcus sp.]|nr:hypothetical protein [Ruminococcus sp.]MCM1382633.1 hypothetical protein [Muribaculaceae bacterium]MCM1480641.1 hypothetical protein [Muribaculaceae bacterium]